MERVTKTTICDMCGAEIDTSDEQTIAKSIIANGCYCVLVHEHNPSYKKGLRTHMTELNIDLCPTCADRATRIHREVVPTDGRRSCRYELSWRDEKPECTCRNLSKYSNYFHCSECGFEYDFLADNPPNYCPSCGARIEVSE